METLLHTLIHLKIINFYFGEAPTINNTVLRPFLSQFNLSRKTAYNFSFLDTPFECNQTPECLFWYNMCRNLKLLVIYWVEIAAIP